jgi:hypothetical protein
LFETVVQGGPLNGRSARYTTMDAALLGHEAMVERVQRGIFTSRLNPPKKLLVSTRMAFIKITNRMVTRTGRPSLRHTGSHWDSYSGGYTGPAVRYERMDEPEAPE